MGGRKEGKPSRHSIGLLKEIEAERKSHELVQPSSLIIDVSINHVALEVIISQSVIIKENEKL